MKITKSESIKENWDQVQSRNYKLPRISQYKSVVYAKLEGEHGEVHTNDIERIYHIISGKGEFVYNNDTTTHYVQRQTNRRKTSGNSTFHGVMG